MMGSYGDVLEGEGKEVEGMDDPVLRGNGGLSQVVVKDLDDVRDD